MKRSLALACLFALAGTHPSATDVTFTLTEAKGTPVVDAVVSLIPLDAPAKLNPRAEPFEIAQSNQEFSAFVTPLVVGSTVIFPNADKVAFVVTFMAGFTVATGVIVLAGAILTGRFQRVRETVLLRTLGATRRQLTQIQLVEYAVLGVLATLTGGGLAVLGNALLAKFVFKTTVSLPLFALFGAMAAAVAVTVVTGLLANRGVADHPPLEILRQET